MPLMFYILAKAIDGLSILIIIWALMSWFRPSPGNPLVRLLNAIVEPILLPIRAVIPPIGGFSFDAMIAIILLSLIKNIFLRAAS
ncbi:MAG: YggT family protein [Holophagaceae bacterium]|nr:YggT family protein [Holophagaceae bacterium]